MLFKDFADCCERISRKKGKNEKIELASELLKKASSSQLKVIPNLLLAKPGIGTKIVHDALQQLVSPKEEEFLDAYDRTGDLGGAAELIFRKKQAPIIKSEPLTVSEVYDSLLRIPMLKGGGSGRRKKKLMVGLLQRSSPLEAKYLIKIACRSMRIGCSEGLVEESIAKAFSFPLEDVKRGFLLLPDLGEIAKIARDGSLQSVKMEIFRPMKHMLADQVDEPKSILKYHKGKTWVEYKYDGARIQIHKDKGKIRIYSRKLEDVTQSLPEVVEEISGIPHNFILDSEAVAWESGPRPFQLLMRRFGRKSVTMEMVEEIPVMVFVFDILFLDGSPLIDSKLEKRREILKSIFDHENRVRISDFFPCTGKKEIEEIFRKAVDKGYEGILAKDPSSPYIIGKRGKHWLKLKKAFASLDLVVIAAELGHGKRHEWLSDYTFGALDSSGKLVPVGKAYSGLGDEEIIELTKILRSITLRREGRKFYVKPEIVMEVKIDSLQKSDTYPAGYALRFARIERIRWDKEWRDADRVERLEYLYRKKFMR
jgi:DNA ligase-1